MAGNGSKTRPLSIKYEEYADNYDNIFRKDKPKPEEVKLEAAKEVKK